MMNELTQNLLRELFDYRNGELGWKESRANNCVKAGDLAGTLRKDGYRDIGINNKSYLTHRLIFLYHHGYLPEFIDHIDGDKSNNCINNLRAATKQQNGMNQKKTKFIEGKPTSSIYKGVCWHKPTKKWMARIMINGKRKHLGRFTSETDAACAYDKAAVEAFGEFAKVNID